MFLIAEIDVEADEAHAITPPANDEPTTQQCPNTGGEASSSTAQGTCQAFEIESSRGCTNNGDCGTGEVCAASSSGSSRSLAAALAAILLSCVSSKNIKTKP